MCVSSISTKSEILVCGSPSALKCCATAAEKARKQPENKGKHWSQLPFASSHVVPMTESVARRRIRIRSSAANYPMCVASGQKKEDTRKRGEGRKGGLKSPLANTTRGETFACRAQRCRISIQRRLAPHFVFAPL